VGFKKPECRPDGGDKQSFPGVPGHIAIRGNLSGLFQELRFCVRGDEEDGQMVPSKNHLRGLHTIQALPQVKIHKHKVHGALTIHDFHGLFA